MVSLFFYAKFIYMPSVFVQKCVLHIYKVYLILFIIVLLFYPIFYFEYISEVAILAVK